MANPRPPSVASLDDSLKSTLTGFHRARWNFLLVFGALASVAVIVLGVIAYRQQQQLRASCQFYRDIAVAKVIVPTGATHPALLGVRIVVDARNTYVNQGCAPALLPPDPSVLRWARFYHLHLTSGPLTPDTPARDPASADVGL